MKDNKLLMVITVVIGTCTLSACNLGPLTIGLNEIPTLIPTLVIPTTIPIPTETLVPTQIPIPTDTVLQLPTTSPTPISTPTETPITPITITFDGVTLYCTCQQCSCLVNQSFTVILTIDAQGNVTGVFKKYLPDFSDIPLRGTIYNITGSIEDVKRTGNFQDFTGSLNNKFNVLKATLYFRGPGGTGKRELYFMKK